MSLSISLPNVFGAHISRHIPWTMQVPFIVDRKFSRLEDTRLATHNLNIRIGKSHILKDVNVEIPQNKITCIIGPSGCGKTTLLRTFNRLVDSIEGVKIDGEVNLGKQDVIANWAIDREFKPEMDADTRTAEIKGWKQAVNSTLGWAK